MPRVTQSFLHKGSSNWQTQKLQPAATLNYQVKKAMAGHQIHKLSYAYIKQVSRQQQHMTLVNMPSADTKLLL